MNTIDDTPLITPTSSALHDALVFPLSDYGTRFVDLPFWLPYIELIATAHNLPIGEIGLGEPGTFPTFIVGRSHVIKLFGTPFEGLRCWAIERDVARLIAGTGTPIPVPAITAAGILSHDPNWRYLVTACVPGESFAVVRDALPEPARLDVATLLGQLLRQVHDLRLPAGTALGSGWSDWIPFIAGQRRSIVERHRVWDTLPPRLLHTIDGYIAGYDMANDIPPSLVHADLHGHHVIGMPCGDTWALRGLIDWGDARAGDRFYELPALHLGLFHGDRAMLTAFLEAYGWSDHRSEAFVRRAMTMTLLHEFNVLEKAAVMVDLASLESLHDLAAALWCV